MITQPNEERWRTAQEHERRGWETLIATREAIVRDCSMYWSRNSRLLDEYIAITEDKRALDLGSGPCPVISHMKSCDKYAIDPLADFFEKSFGTPSEMTYLQGSGENLPFSNETFDLVVTKNVIDHVRSPQEVLHEVRRILKSRGVCYLSVNCYGPLVSIFKSGLEYFGFGDPCHPHTFRTEDIKILVKEAGLELLYAGGESKVVEEPSDSNNDNPPDESVMVNDEVDKHRLRKKTLLRAYNYVCKTLANIDETNSNPPFCVYQVLIFRM